MAQEVLPPGPETVVHRSVSRRRLLLSALAVVLAATALVHAAIWSYYIRWGAPQAYLGIEYGYDAPSRSATLKKVAPGSPAERAGLHVNDRLVAVNGRRLDTLNPFHDAVIRGTPGNTIELAVRKGGTGTVTAVRATLRPPPAHEHRPTLGRQIALGVLNLFPLPFMVVGLAVLALRVEDRHAWLLALLFVGMGASGPDTHLPFMHPAFRGFAVGYAQLFNFGNPALFYLVLATFPAPSALDRRVPWLKWAFAAVALGVGVPVAIACAAAGSIAPVVRAILALGETRVGVTISVYAWGAVALGFLSLALNCARPPSVEAGRKARLVAWSFVVGMTPWLVLQAVGLALGKYPMAFPFWIWAPAAMMLMLLPVMFGYAVVKHRVLEFSVLVRRSARYVLVQRGFALITVALSIGVTALFAMYGARLLPRLTDAAVPVGIAAGAVFGLVIVRTGGAVARRVTQRIDRAFFREAYDARRVLEHLTQRARDATSRPELASLLDAEIANALHPRLVAVYLKSRDGVLDLVRGPAGAPPIVGAALPVIEKLTRHGQAWNVPPPGDADAMVAAPLATLAPECLVPLLGRRGEVIGLVVLGPRLSEEPYGRDDRALLTSVSRQAGLALESLALAEEMAERIEAERRAAHEVEIAAEVQRRMLPQRHVAMTSLDYAGRCRQARAVGGDYYDFLEFGPGQLGLALGDISGKGLYASLLMANLQASLRSLTRQLAEDLPGALRAVNRSFGESTAGNHYATLFLGHYDDKTRRFRYASCGHLPPFLLRAGGAVERLAVTAGAIGMFEPWACDARELILGSGDLLVVFSDGVTEALDPGGQEFGEAGLLEVLQSHRDLPVAALLDAVIDAVLAFSAREQQDDLTLVVARGR